VKEQKKDYYDAIIGPVQIGSIFVVCFALSDSTVKYGGPIIALRKKTAPLRLRRAGQRGIALQKHVGTTQQ
jgi:hypothetical protein